MNSNVFIPQIIYRGFIKSGYVWRQILSFNNVDVCAVAAGVNNFPFLVTVRDIFLAKFTVFPRRCPALPGKYYARNISLTLDDSQSLNDAMSPTPLPNGVYRHVIRWFNKDDPIGFALYFHIEINIRMNEDRF